MVQQPEVRFQLRRLEREDAAIVPEVQSVKLFTTQGLRSVQDCLPRSHQLSGRKPADVSDLYGFSTPMTATEYRQHMRTYSKDTMVMSFVVTDHPDYQALKAAGMEVAPYLLVDLIDPDWHCDACYGEGFEFPAGWAWDNKKRNWPTDTGIPCPKCMGKGSINTWACIMLLTEIAGDDRPKVEVYMQGRHAALIDLWRKWGELRGYLPPTTDTPGGLVGFIKKLGSKIWS